MFNQFILVGRLTADPELKKTKNDVPVVGFSLAVDRPYRKDAEKQTDFINITAWRGTAEFIVKYFSKGSAIGVEGSIQTHSYTDKDGNKRTAFEVVAEKAFFVESKGSSEKKNESPKAATASSSDDFQEVENYEDDDLPF